MNNQTGTLVSLRKIRVPGAPVRLDVYVENVPKDLFGAAFHLNVSGKDWHLLNYEDGGIFGKGIQPVIMAAETAGESHEIVFGITLKNGDRPDVRDGRLVSFYLTADGGEIADAGFSDTHMSVYNGGRLDLKDVEWRGTGTQYENAAGGGLTGVLAGGLPSTAQGGADSQDGFYWMIGLGLVFFLTVFVIFAAIWKLYFIRINGRKKGKDQEILT